MERKIDELTEEINVLISKERACNDELQGVRKELIMVTSLLFDMIIIVWQCIVLMFLIY